MERPLFKFEVLGWVGYYRFDIIWLRKTIMKKQRKGKILVVDYEETIRKSLKMILKACSDILCSR